MSIEPNKRVFQLRYVDRRGASVVRALSAAEVGEILPTLRRGAVLVAALADGGDRVVGGVEPSPWGADGERVRWRWWYDLNVIDGRRL